MKTILSLCLLFASFLSSAYAQNTTSQAIEDRRYKAPSDAVGALGPDLFGEQVDHNTGATSFSVTDIDLPGNNALPVRLTRTMKISVSDGFPHLVPIGAIVSGAAGAGFSGWSIEVPNLSGVFTTGPDGTTTPQNYGWKADSATPNARCSTGSGMPPRFESLDGIAGEPYKYWSGTRLSVPGQVSGDILLTTTTSQNNTAQAARWTTKDHWLLTCLPTIQNGSGEGFLAISPDGTKYYFNRMIVRNGINRYSRIPFFTTATGGTVKMNRGRIFLAATRVEDRFGNFVSYNYDSANKLTSISASDGRLISFTYNSSSVLTSAMAHGKTWTFQYGADQKLLSVTLPDTSKWVYTQVFTSGLFRGSIGVDDPIVQVECDNGLAYPVSDSTFSPDTDAAQVTVQHPSGAAGTFVFRHREYYNPWAGSCTNHEAEPLHYIDALVSKKK